MDDDGGLGDIGDAPAAARVTLPELREALGGPPEIAPAAAGTGGALWPDPPAARQWLRRLGRADCVLILAIVGTTATAYRICNSPASW